MSNFIINTVLNGSPELSRDGGVTFETVVGAKRMERNAASVVLHISENKDVITITPAKDSITVNQTATGGSSVTYAPTDNSLVSTLTLHRTLNPVFPKANSSAGGSGVAVKADDATAFAAIQNGQSQDFEVSGVVSRYIKNSTGDKQIITYPTYP